MDNRVKKLDIILILILLAAALIFALRMRVRQETASEAEILVEGEVVQVVNLKEDSEFLIHGFQGGINHIVVSQGFIWCDEASCPDKVCVHTGKISLNTETIACLPNKMIIRIK
ncbi:NusG domain II-containing protein [Lachnospiraceae bacterium 62-35]